MGSIFSALRAQSFLSTGPIAFFGTDRYSRFGLDINPRTDIGLISEFSGDVGTVLKAAASHNDGCCCGACAEGGSSSQGQTGPSFAPDLVPGSIASTATITVGGSVDVSIDTLGDHDWYRVTLVAGQTYTIQTSSDGAGTDAFLNLRDAAGTILASDDDSGDSVNSLITFTATTSGTYFIDAGTYNNETTGTYHLFVAPTVPAGDSVLGSTATTATLAVGGAVNGNIDSSGDHDYYAITLVAGQTYLFRTAPTATTDTTDTILTLRNSAGAQLATSDDAGEFSFSAIRYTATTSGTFYLDVSAFGATTGAFNLTAFTAQPLTVFTNDQIANQLTAGYWGGTTRRWNVAPGGTITVNLTALTTDGIFLAREALGLWTDATGISFSEVASGGQITFDDNQTGAFANSTRVGSFITSSTVNVGTAWLTTYGVTLRTYSFQTYIHEIGHALGLGHGGNYNGNAAYATDALYSNDSWATTIMSYFDQQENTYFADQGFTRQFAVSPLLADLIGTTSLYGTATTTRTGDSTYGFNNNSGRAIFDAAAGVSALGYTIVDHGGIDTLNYSGYTQNQRINLNAETFSDVGGRVGNVSIARGTVIENAATGSGNDTLIGNAANNVLDGGSGISTLMGNGGDDRLFLRSGAAGSSIDGGQGTDVLVINNTVSSLSLLTGIEGVEFAGGAGLTLTGTQFNDGLAVNTSLYGFGTITVDMTAGVFFVANNFVVTGGSNVTMTINGANDVNIIKAANVVNTINGGTDVDQIRGGTLGDIINGNGGDDKIIGFSGADVITGGAGADQFRYLLTSDSGFGAARDRITDFAIGSDRLNFAFFDADPLTAGDQAFNFVGTAAFTNTGIGQVRYATSGADIIVQADVNGDGVADMEILLQGIGGGTMTAGDFIL